jgi:hypothetical protein
LTQELAVEGGTRILQSGHTSKIAVIPAQAGIQNLVQWCISGFPPSRE